MIPDAHVNSSRGTAQVRRGAKPARPDKDTTAPRGKFFYDGKGVAQSYEEAVRWYRLAAAQGYADALFNLGACHANGHGVPQDYHEALRLFKRAAAKGHAGAAAQVERLGPRLAAHSGRPA
mmetsp:Transcript_18308/g.63088  ORF Transcript_18308/g.63088 Transcript_18308/m.63088 type:complete len:121 (-) Transcript_18308:106-468(-)